MTPSVALGLRPGDWSCAKKTEEWGRRAQESAALGQTEKSPVRGLVATSTAAFNPNGLKMDSQMQGRVDIGQL